MCLLLLQHVRHDGYLWESPLLSLTFTTGGWIIFTFSLPLGKIGVDTLLTALLLLFL